MSPPSLPLGVCAVVSNVFVGVIAGVQADSDPQGKAYKSNCDRLDHFLREVKAHMVVVDVAQMGEVDVARQDRNVDVVARLEAIR